MNNEKNFDTLFSIVRDLFEIIKDQRATIDDLNRKLKSREFENIMDINRLNGLEKCINDFVETIGVAHSWSDFNKDRDETISKILEDR